MQESQKHAKKFILFEIYSFHPDTRLISHNKQKK